MPKQLFLSVSSPSKHDDKLIECQRCDYFKRIIDIKDMTIQKLNEDRDELKYKLTAINNSNIELNQKMKRLSTGLNEAQKHQIDSSIKTDHNDHNESQLRERCAQLEAINEHLQQHLTTLRNVFKDFYNSTTSSSTTNESKASNTTFTIPSSSGSTDDTSTVNLDLTTTTSTTKNNEFESSFDKWYKKS